jgi:hypothetical protein
VVLPCKTGGEVGKPVHKGDKERRNAELGSLVIDLEFHERSCLFIAKNKYPMLSV